MRVQTRIDEYGLFVPLIIFKSEIKDLAVEDAEAVVMKRCAELTKEVLEKWKEIHEPPKKKHSN